VWVQLQPRREFTLDPPGVWREAALCRYWEVEILSGNTCLRRLRDNFEGSWIALRGLCERGTCRGQKKKEKAATRR